MTIAVNHGREATQQQQRPNNIVSDEVAPNEPPHQDLYCVQIQLFSFLTLEVLLFHVQGKQLSSCR